MLPALGTLVLAALPCVGAPLFAAAVEGQTEFEAALAQVESLMKQSRWDRARTLLKDELALHKDQEYVRARLPEIKTQLERCAVEVAVPRKQVKDLFSARSVAWDAKKGEIELVYEREKAGAKAGEAALAFPPADFQQVDGIGFVPDRGKLVQRSVRVWVHALPFTTACTLELAGTGMGSGSPSLRIGIAGRSCVETLILPGDAPRILQVVEGESEPRSLAIQTGMINAVLPYTLEVRADKSKVEGWYKDKRVVAAKRAAEPSGQVGFADVDGVRKIRLAGKVDTKWIEERLAALQQADREAFAKSYDVQSDLPAWLR